MGHFLEEGVMNMVHLFSISLEYTFNSLLRLFDLSSDRSSGKLGMVPHGGVIL